ncbi:MAG: hypothetical protein LBF08_03230 [Dysgonamonadaceae bacterium]|jgi:hypothetical protein|nr:hypothetical protein [Dysgonamonadaceae bacterium]
MITVINPAFDYLTSFVEAIPDVFGKEGETIHNARNHVKIFDANNEKLVVKSFKIPFFFNRIIYTCFRPSKAERSYKHAMKLIERQINTSQPVAYIENRANGLLTGSYYVSIYKEYPGNLQEFRYHTLEEKKDLAIAFARFTAELHEKAIFPLDYSPGNILYEKTGDEYHFCLVDLNRMRFMPVDPKTGAYGLRRLWGNEETIAFIAREYARVRKFDEKKYEELALRYHRSFWDKYSRKHQGFQAYERTKS